MKLLLSYPSIKYPFQINYTDKIFFVGSCFTENIGKKLSNLHFPILSNPSGILFDPKSILKNIDFYINNIQIQNKNLFYYKDIWRSWQHHTNYTNIDDTRLCDDINASCNQAHNFLAKADYVFITLGSAFAYYLKSEAHFVANCHQYPQTNFEKKLISSDEIVPDMEGLLEQIFKFNPKIKIILTVSPVRHIRDGVIENNRSKANLIEATHRLVERNIEKVFYFPSYEIIIDVLRDYRFYDIDLVHPNYLATELVMQYWIDVFLSTECKQYVKLLEPIIQAKQHKPLHPDSVAHKIFLQQLKDNILSFKKQYPRCNNL